MVSSAQELSLQCLPQSHKNLRKITTESRNTIYQILYPELECSANVKRHAGCQVILQLP